MEWLICMPQNRKTTLLFIVIFFQPPKIRAFINSVTSTPLEEIEKPLKSFTWEFDKGDFHHWVDLFNHFDSFFEKYIVPRKDLQVGDNFLDVDPPFPREAVLQILRAIRIILQKCTNKHFYSSYERHLSYLLASADADVVEASLQTLAAILKKSSGKGSIRDPLLHSKLFAFSQGWGAKEEGLGLIACSTENACDSMAYQLGCTLHFEFYDANESHMGGSGRGLQVIHLPDINSRDETDLELLNKLILEYKVPSKLRFSLLTRLRFARAFGSLATRQQYTCIRLYAFVVLVQATSDSDDLTAFFDNEPEFVDDLVSLLSYEDVVPEKIRILGILSLVALCHDRSHQTTVLSVVTSGGHRGILPSLMQKAIDSVMSESSKWSIVFTEALLSLVTTLVSSSSGCIALRQAGFVPTLLPLLKDTNPQHLHLVSTAVHVLEAFMDYSNSSDSLFRDLGGLDDTIFRLKFEVCSIEKGSRKNGEETQCNWKGKEVIDTTGELDMQPLYSEALVAYHRRLLMKALLRAISLDTYAPGNSARSYSLEDSLLPECLCIIFRRAKDFGGGVFSLAATVMSDLIHKDPTCFLVLNAAELPSAFLDALLGGVLCSSEAIACIPQCLDALCLNSVGLQAVKHRNALRCFVKIFTSRTYLRALAGDTPGTLSSNLDELMRHASALRGPGVDMLIEILNTIMKIGSGVELPSSSSESPNSSAPVPMETDMEEKNPVSSDEGEPSKAEGVEQMIEASSEGTSVNMESFLPECINNIAQLLDNILQNSDTCRLFIDKKGIEAVLQLFTLPLLPLSATSNLNISAAFRNFSPQHSAALARAVCAFLKDHIKSTSEALNSVGGVKLTRLEGVAQMKVLRCLSSLECLLSFSISLLKGTTTIMISELGVADADVLKDFGRTYKELLWQISLNSNANSDEKRELDQETGASGSVPSSVNGRWSDDDASLIPGFRYVNPVSMRSSSTSRWRRDPFFLTPMHPGDVMHRHGRRDHALDSLTRWRASRSTRLEESMNIDIEGTSNASESSQVQEVKKKSLDTVISEVLAKLASTTRSLYAVLVKGLTAPNRRRFDSGPMSSAAKSLAVAIAKIFHECLSYSGHSTSTGLELSLSVKCRYLGKVVEDMVALTFDSRKRLCSTVLINNFYVHGTFKELLTTYEATSQLLWTLPFSISGSCVDQGKALEDHKLSHTSWLMKTLQSYCRLLECFVNSSLLLSFPSQLLVQPVAAGLSIGFFPIPKEPEAFVRLLQSQVLDVILPIWNHPSFPQCSPVFITSITSIINHIYSGVGEVKKNKTSVVGTTNPRYMGPPLDESTIVTIVEMGFTRARAEEALRRVETTSVEMAMDWLVSHPEEPVQEDVDLARALALSLGNSSESSKEDGSEKIQDIPTEERVTEIPPVDDILAASMKLFQCGDSLAFPLSDLLVTLCSRNKGEDRSKVAIYLIQQLKLAKVDFSEKGKECVALSAFSHILCLILNEDSSVREIAAVNGMVSAALNILMDFKLRRYSGQEVHYPKCVSALLLIVDLMSQLKPKVSLNTTEGTILGSLVNSSGGDTSLPPFSSVEGRSTAAGDERETRNAFEKVLGKPTGYLSVEEGHAAVDMAIEFMKQHVPSAVMQASLQLCARLTKSHILALQFLDSGGLAALFSLPRSCFFPGYDTFASTIIRHLLEDPQTLQAAMELEIKHTMAGSLSRHGSHVPPRIFLTSMAPVIARDPTIFMRAVTAVCQLESSGGRVTIGLSREKDKEKDKAKSASIEVGISSDEGIRFPEITNKSHDGQAKYSKGHKRVPQSLTQVIDQLLEIILEYPSPRKHGEYASHITAMEVDEPISKEKGKSKVSEMVQSDEHNLSECSANLAKVTFVLKLMSDTLLMYSHAAGVVLKRDLEACQLRGPGQVDGPAHTGILHHVIHQLLPLFSDKTSESAEEWKDKLSERASWLLVVLCGRSGEGRRRIIGEIVRSLNSYSSQVGYSSRHVISPDKRILAFADLVNSILSKNSSSANLLGPVCSPDAAKTMIDYGVVQALTGILQVIDLDHPDALKTVNLIIKALEALSRAAISSEQTSKSDGHVKKRSTATIGRTEDQTVGLPNGGIIENEQNTGQGERLGAEPSEGQFHGISSGQNVGEHDGNDNQSMEQDMRVEVDGPLSNDHQAMDHGEEFMREDIEEGDTNGVGITFRVEHGPNDDMGDEDEDDVGDDGEEDDDDEDEDEEEDEDITEEGAAHLSMVDTDVDDHDDNGLGDEYNEDVVDEEDDDFHGSRVIEVSLSEGLDGLDGLQVLGQPGASGSVVDVSASFRGIHVDDIFGFRRSVGVDRRHQTSSRSFLERPGLDHVNTLQHPLLMRPPQSGETNTSTWLANGIGTSRDVEALSVRNFDLAHFYTFDTPGVVHDHTPVTWSDPLVGSASPLIDFSIGMESMHVMGRRGGHGDSRWTDDGQPQAGTQAAIIAQAVEDLFINRFLSLVPMERLPTQGLSENPEGQERQRLDISPSNGGKQIEVAGNSVENQQDEGQHAIAENLGPNLPVGSDNTGTQPKEGEQISTHADQCRSSENMQTLEGTVANHRHSELVQNAGPEIPLPSFDVRNESFDQDCVAMDADLSEIELQREVTPGPSGMESESSTYAMLVSADEVRGSGCAQSGSIHANEDVEMDGVDASVNQAESRDPSSNLRVDEPLSEPNARDAQDANQDEQANVGDENGSANAIDPTFLEALPEDLRAEVLASQQAQPARAATYTPPLAEDIDPEFLAALPPDIQAEVLAQQRAQRVVQSQQAVGQPVDMDNASIIATFPADLREEVLLTSSEAVLSGLPSPLLVEAQMLRDRAMSHYQARSIFGSSHRLGGRRNTLGIDRHTAMDRGVGVTIGRRAVAALARNTKVKEIEGTPLLDANALRALIRLLRLAQPLSKGLLHRLLLNLCAHGGTRATLVRFLLDMIRPEAEGLVCGSTSISSQRLYGCQWNVVYGRPQMADGLPPLVSRRVLEILTYLATSHLPVADNLFYYHSLPLESPNQAGSDIKKEKGKGKISEGSGSSSLGTSQNIKIPLILFLKLLNQPLFLRSSAHLEQVIGLLQVVVNNAATKVKCQLHSRQVLDGSQSLPDKSAPSDTRKDGPASEQTELKEPEKSSTTNASTSGGKEEVNPYDVLLQLPESDLRNLCSLLAHEGLSDKVYSLAAEVLKKLAFAVVPHRKFFTSELASLANGLSGSSVHELANVASTQMLELNTGSMAGAAILRVLQTLSSLASVGDSYRVEQREKEHCEQTIMWELDLALEPLWQELSACISKTETNLMHIQAFPSPSHSSNAGDHGGGASASSPPLPPGSQRLLPFIEAFFVLCEKLQYNQSIISQPEQIDVTAREVKESAGASRLSNMKSGCVGQRRSDGSMTFTRFADRHRRLLNAFIRQSPGLLEKSLSLMLKAPRLIDFDNKRSYFQSRIRQQHEIHPSPPLRVSVRRAYVLEDSFNQLRMRSSQDLKGRLTVQFQGEEGIDAGGLTREWYQLLSRVIFDKGALLFTTVGNNTTFQPNPNSVYQTEHLSYFKFVGRVVAKALFDGHLLDVYFTRSFYKHILGVKVTYHDIEAVDPDFYKNLKWMLENDVSDIPDLTFSMDADEEKHILYGKSEVTDYELIPGGRNIRVTEETKHEYVDLVAEHRLTTAIRPQINSFLEGFNELIPKELISLFNDKELELLISGLPEIDLDDLKANAEYSGYTAVSSVIQWFWEVVKTFNKEDMARLLQFVTGTSKVPLDGFKDLQGISGPQHFQIHKAYGAPERLPTAHTCFNQLDLPEYSSKEQLQERLLLAVHEASEGFGFG
ncbi:hypothetical protein AMTRI_Chr10g7440 [Amborella trichopoda]